MTLSNNLKVFSALAVLLSIAFFYLLFAALQSQSYGNIWLLAISFGSAMFVSGLLLGYNDPIRKSRTDLGFQYHLMTFIIVNIIGIPWMLAAMGVNLSTLLTVFFQSVPWTLGLFLHYYLSKRTIKGMDPGKIFD